MVKQSQAPLDALFGALADPTRRAILLALTRGAAPVTELAEPLPLSLPAVSRHLRVLEDAGLVARAREGRVHRISLVSEPMLEALEWIATFGPFWEHQLESLERFLTRRPDEPATGDTR
jgi:DNA-binding transcriptional ArsR family regulator